MKRMIKDKEREGERESMIPFVSSVWPISGRWSEKDIRGKIIKIGTKRKKKKCARETYHDDSLYLEMVLSVWSICSSSGRWSELSGSTSRWIMMLWPTYTLTIWMKYELHLKNARINNHVAHAQFMLGQMVGAVGVHTTRWIMILCPTCIYKIVMWYFPKRLCLNWFLNTLWKYRCNKYFTSNW